MSYADKVFKGMCRDILDNGVSTEGEKVRPVWEDTNESARNSAWLTVTICEKNFRH